MNHDWLNVSWKMLVVRGVLAIIFGIVAMVWPVTTAIALALMWGVWAVVDGISALAQAFQPEAIGRGWLVAMGILGLLAGLFAIFRPGVTAVGLTWILGIWLVVRGLFELFGAFSSTIAQPRWLLFLSAALSIVLGLLFAFNPGTSAVAVAFWLGLMALAWGAVFIVVGFMVRREGAAHQVAPGAPGAPA